MTVIKNSSIFVSKQIYKYFLNKSFFLKKIYILQNKNINSKKGFIYDKKSIFNNLVSLKKFKKFIFNNRHILKNKVSNKIVSTVLTKLAIKNQNSILNAKNTFLYEKFLKSFLTKKCETYQFNFFLSNLLLEVIKSTKNDNNTAVFSADEFLFLKKFYILLKNKPKYLLTSKNEYLLKNKAIVLLLKKYYLFSKINNNQLIYFLYNSMLLAYLKTTKNIKYNKELFVNLESLKISNNSKKLTTINSFYKKFVGLCIKKGEKTKALKFVQETLQNVSRELNISTNFILLKLLNRLKMSLELKTVRKKVRKTKKKIFHIVPYPIRKKRELFLIIKLILKSIDKKDVKKSSTQKLTQELITLFKAKKKSAAFKIKRSTIQAALKNRSNKHFRW